MEETINCPLVDSPIAVIDCIVTTDVIDGIIIEDAISDKYKTKIDWKEICLNCKYHGF